MQEDANQRMLQEYSRYILPVLKFREIVISHGKGSYVWDLDNRKYLDLNSGQFCAIFGHSDEDLAEHLFKMALKIQDTDTATLSEDVLHAAKAMSDIAEGMDGRVIFLSTGAEANECCLRYAKHLKEKDGVVAFDLGYHGLSHGTAAYSMSRDRIRPTIRHSYVVRAPRTYPDAAGVDCNLDEYVEDFEKVVRNNLDHIAAAIFEPVISGGGLYFPPKEYFRRIREICNHYGVFLIFDECQTGFGRTGTWFHYQQLECVPDFLVCAKAMGLGYPVSCVVANGKTITNDLFVLQHYSSHQNEPFAASLVSYAIDKIRRSKMLAANAAKGRSLLETLVRLSRRHEMLVDPRGIGLMTGFNLNVPGGGDSKEIGDKFVRTALRHGLILQHCNNGKTIRLLPNYIISEEDIDHFHDCLDNAFADFGQV